MAGIIIPDASSTKDGTINTTTQTVAGAKTFSSPVAVSDTTDATSSTGSIIASGGLSVAKKIVSSDNIQAFESAVFTYNGVTASVGANSNTTLYATATNQAYLVHVKGNSDAGYAAVFILWNTAGGINSVRLGGHSSMSLTQQAANVVQLTITAGHAGQTYNFTVLRFSVN